MTALCVQRKWSEGGALPSARWQRGVTASITSASVGMCLLGSGLFGVVESQAPDRSDPNRLRPPTVAVGTADEAAAAVFTLFLGEFVRALSQRDTISLKLVVPDSIIPAAEREAGSRLGCLSLAQAVTQLGRSRHVAGEAHVVVDSLEQPVVLAPNSSQGNGALTGRANLSLVDPARMAPKWRVQIDMSPHSHSRQVEAIHGLLTGLCRAVSS